MIHSLSDPALAGGAHSNKTAHPPNSRESHRNRGIGRGGVHRGSRSPSATTAFSP